MSVHTSMCTLILVVWMHDQEKVALEATTSGKYLLVNRIDFQRFMYNRVDNFNKGLKHPFSSINMR